MWVIFIVVMSFSVFGKIVDTYSFILFSIVWLYLIVIYKQINK
jgi:hypothetical protein